MTKFIKLAAKLGIKQLADWYYVYKTSIAEHGGSSLLRRFKGNMHEILKQGYPEYLINILIYVRKSILFKKRHQWDEKKLQIKRQLGQKRLESVVQKLFPDTRRIVNTRKLPSIKIC